MRSILSSFHWASLLRAPLYLSSGDRGNVSLARIHMAISKSMKHAMVGDGIGSRCGGRERGAPRNKCSVEMLINSEKARANLLVSE